MHYPLAIARNRTALLAVVAAIVALIGGRDGGLIARRLRKAALALLRPAEAAVRRLIVIAARDLPAPAPRPAPPPGVFGSGHGRAGGSFRLFDRPKRYAPLLRRPEPLGVPRIRSFGGPASPLAPVFQAPAPAPAAKPLPPDPDALVDCARLRLRVAALDRALADLPRQARRLARWRARAEKRPVGARPLRLGRPPGWRARPAHDVDHVLRDCHALALEAVRRDTS